MIRTQITNENPHNLSTRASKAVRNHTHSFNLQKQNLEFEKQRFKNTEHENLSFGKGEKKKKPYTR